MREHRNLKDRLTGSLGRVATAAVRCSLAGVALGELGRFHWFLDLFSHFMMQYLFILLGAFVWSAIRKRWRGLTVCCVAVCWIVFRVAPLWLDTGKVTNDRPNLRLMTMNVFAGNDDYKQALQSVRDTQPHVLVVQEVTPHWSERLKELEDQYPHTLFAPRDDAFGMAVLSRLPMQSADTHLIGDVPWMEFVVELNGQQRVMLLAAHTLPPAGRVYSTIRNRQLRAIDDTVERATTSGLPVVIAGDLNCTPWSGHMRDLLERNALCSARRGFGWNASWPTNRPFLLIPIDHVLVSQQVGVNRFSTLDSVGSDHFPVVADLVVGHAPVGPAD